MESSRIQRKCKVNQYGLRDGGRVEMDNKIKALKNQTKWELWDLGFSILISLT